MKKSSGDILYEINQLFYSGGKVLELNKQQNETNDPVRKDAIQLDINCSLDSFAIHVKTLIELFFDKKPVKNYVPAKDFIRDDKLKEWGAFIDASSFPKNELRKKANQQVSHLTYDRLKYVGIRKSWNISEICRGFSSIIRQFLILARDDYLSDEFLESKTQLFGKK